MEKQMIFEGKFRKKPVVIDAHVFDGGEFSAAAVKEWSNNQVEPAMNTAGKFMGFMRVIHAGSLLIVTAGDWVIRDVKGEYYPCKPDIFEMLYEPAE